MTDFRALILALCRCQVEFILVGGLAAVAHGSARLTQDVDIVYSRTPENLLALVNALAEHRPYLRGAPPGLPFSWSPETLRRGLNFTLTTGVGDIDLFGEIVGGGGYGDLRPHSTELELFGQSVLCLGLEKLIHVKRAAGRPRDLEAIAELESLRDEFD